MSAALAHDREPWRDLIDLDALARWTDARGLGTGAIADAEPLGGGTQTILPRLAWADHRYVLRRPPSRTRPIAEQPEPAVLGTDSYLTESIDDFNPTQGLPPLHAGDPDDMSQLGKMKIRESDAMNGGGRQ